MRSAQGSAQDMAKRRVRRSRACGGPLLDPTSRWKYPSDFIYLPTQFHTGAENVVNGVKTIMVNEPLRTAPSRRIAKSAVLRRSKGRKRCPASPFGTTHDQAETADGKIIRHR